MAHSGKTMTFATDLVPQEDNIYSLGKDNLKWVIRGSLPLSDVTGADDLKAIEALTGTSGLLKKTAANTWALDTSSYVTSSGVTSITIKTSSPLTGGSNTATTGTGTYTLGIDTSGTWSGIATKATKANLTTTTDAIAYYSDTAGTFANGQYVTYLKHTAAKAGTNQVGYLDGLRISGTAYGEAENLKSGVAGKLSYGDSGP